MDFIKFIPITLDVVGILVSCVDGLYGEFCVELESAGKKVKMYSKVDLKEFKGKKVNVRVSVCSSKIITDDKGEKRAYTNGKIIELVPVVAK